MAKLLYNAAETKKRIRKVADEPETTITAATLVPDINNNDKIITGKATKKSKKHQSNFDSTAVSNDPKEMKENVVYIGHIPDGFFEKEMRKFFSQFGEVNRVKLFRSKKSLRSKGYAFVEFSDEEVARTVSQTMNGYMMHDKTLVSNVVPKAKMHDGMFKRPKVLAVNTS
jgi:RNA recognition motif-containing protein